MYTKKDDEKFYTLMGEKRREIDELVVDGEYVTDDTIRVLKAHVEELMDDYKAKKAKYLEREVKKRLYDEKKGSEHELNQKDINLRRIQEECPKILENIASTDVEVDEAVKGVKGVIAKILKHRMRRSSN